MNIKYSPFIFVILIVIISFLGNSYFKSENPAVDNKPIPKPVKSVRNIIEERKSVSKFDNVSLFDFKNNGDKSSGLEKYAKSFSVLSLKKSNVKDILDSPKENITLEIPVSDKGFLYLELVKTKVFSDNFEIRMITESGIVPLENKSGLFYRGIVKGNPNSAVAISVFENSVTGVISDETGNHNLVALKDDLNKESYIYYNDKDLYVKNKFKCNVDNYSKLKLGNSKPVNPGSYSDNPSSRLPVKTYFVADYQMYFDFGFNVSNVKEFISSVFNEVATIYQNEFLPIQISAIDVYTTPDPYRNMHDPIEILMAFGDNTKDNFNGSLAHLLTTRNESFGGISWVNTLCASYNANEHSGRFSFSGIETGFQPFPVYSWTVMVIAHEMGHSFGSSHTHACIWPITQNIIGQIDSCYEPEGIDCVNKTHVVPNQNGTVMSYCHLEGAINLHLGFGPMPGDTIRFCYNLCDKFGPVVNSSELPTAYQLDQNYPNPFNPVTNINFAVPEDAFVTLKVYDITGREVAELINNKFYSRGYQNVMFNSSMYNISSGIYFYKLVASHSGGNTYSQVKKMVLVK